MSRRENVLLFGRSAMARRSTRSSTPSRRVGLMVCFPEELTERLRHAWWSADPVISEAGQDLVWEAMCRLAVRRYDGDGGS